MSDKKILKDFKDKFVKADSNWVKAKKIKDSEYVLIIRKVNPDIHNLKKVKEGNTKDLKKAFDPKYYKYYYLRYEKH